MDFSEFFLTSNNLTIGVNYSAKLIDNCIDLLRQRTLRKLETTIITIREGSPAEVFLAQDYGTNDIPVGLRKIDEIVSDLDPDDSYIRIVRVDTLLRYSFVRFDSRIWVVVGTNGPGTS